MNSKTTRERILITGASGFISRALIQFLRSQGNTDLYLCDRLAVEGEGITSVDLSDSQRAAELIASVRPTQIYHLAGSFSNDYQTDYQANVETTKNICDALIAQNITARVLLIGSASEYGTVNQNENPVSEHQPLRPLTVYGLTKAYQSLLMQFYHNKHGLDLVMARTFNLYGEGISPRLLAGKIYQQLNNGDRRITLDDVTARRDYLHVSKVVGYYHHIMERGLPGEVYNVGSGVALSTRDLIIRIITETGLDPAEFEIQATGEQMSVQEIYADTRKLTSLEPLV